MTTQEIKGNLARLLATENLIVEHRKVPTASFDVERRVLTLPNWDRASGVVYDMLVGHEVGHALFTPNEDWTSEHKCPKDFINVIEDARIEKLMKRKYPGLRKSFSGGYKELNDKDFFGIEGEDFDTFSLIDRINLHFKIGASAMLPFSIEEQVFVARTDLAETFEEVCQIAVDVYNFSKQEKVQEPAPQEMPASQQQQGGGDNENIDAEQSEQQGEQMTHEEMLEEAERREEENDVGDYDEPGEVGSETQSNFDRAAEQLTNKYSNNPVYVEIPESVDLPTYIADWTEVHDWIDEYRSKFLAGGEDIDRSDRYDDVDKSYREFRKQSQKEVNYLVKEFECRKSADAYARAGQSKTGVLNTSKLHTYKYNDDIFKKVTVLPDGKNHGMIFVLDWSGSMGTVLMDTVKQLINLCWFCRKVQIPFEVYAFTYEWNDAYFQGDEEEYGQEYAYERKNNMLSVHKRFSLLNLATSRSNSKSFDTSIKHLYRLAYYYSRSAIYYHNPMGLDLSGTPLNESLITLKTLIPQFQKQNDLQKVNVCILTDGEGNNLSYDVELNDYVGNRSVQANCCLRDRKIGRTYRHFDYEITNSLTTILLENLKDSFPQVNFIGFRIGNGSDFSQLYKGIHGWKHDHDAIMKQWRKQKSWELNGLGYDSLYVLGQTTLSSDVEFDVEAGAKKTEISKSFRSMLKAKTTNKKILSSFATDIS